MGKSEEEGFLLSLISAYWTASSILSINVNNVKCGSRLDCNSTTALVSQCQVAAHCSRLSYRGAVQPDNILPLPHFPLVFNHLIILNYYYLVTRYAFFRYLFCFVMKCFCGPDIELLYPNDLLYSSSGVLFLCVIQRSCDWRCHHLFYYGKCLMVTSGDLTTPHWTTIS